jgi:predicted Zn finger-like uncharacterized protein
MALATTCPQCKTSFKVVPDQLKLSRGSVRCGVCQNVFSGIDHLRYVDQSALQSPKPRQSGADTGPKPASAANSNQAAGDPSATSGAPTAQNHPSGSDDLKTAFFLPDSGFGDQVSDALAGAARSPKRDIDFSNLPRVPFSPSVPSDRPESKQGDAIDKTTDSEQPSQASGPVEAFWPLDASSDSPPDSASIPDSDAAQDTGAWQQGDKRTSSSRPEISTPDQPAASTSAIDIAPRAATPTDFSDLAKSRHGKRQPVAVMIAVGLLIGLLVQALIGWRDQIAARSPGISPVLESVLDPFGLKISPPLDLSALSIESFELQTGRSKNLLQMTAVLRNRGSHVVGFPAMELTLTDSSGALLSRKVIRVESYLDTPLIAAQGLAGRSEWPIRIALEHDGLEPAGYSVALFYP